MGLSFAEYNFDHPHPSIDQIAASITEITGLPVDLSSIDERICIMPCDPEVLEPNAKISFTCLPEVGINLCMSQLLNENNAELKEINMMYFAMQEPTLVNVTAYVLEKLGGHTTDNFSEKDREQYVGPASEKEIFERNNKSLRAQNNAYLQVVGFYLAILLGAFGILYSIFFSPSEQPVSNPIPRESISVPAPEMPPMEAP